MELNLSGVWSPAPLFKGQTCFVLGSGPSLTKSVVDRVRGNNVIAVNGAGILAPWASVLFFNDSTWFRSHRSLVEAWTGLVVTTSRRASQTNDRIKRIQIEERPDFPPVRRGIVRGGHSSGHKAVSLAIAFGAVRVVLLGFDMREVDGRTHFHDEYRNDPTRYRDLFIPGFAGWREAARKIGVEIVNATPGSALEEFEMTALDVELSTECGIT